MTDRKTFRREVRANSQLVVSTCVYCAHMAASGDLRLLVLAETLHDCYQKKESRNITNMPVNSEKAARSRGAGVLRSRPMRQSCL